MNRSRYLVWLLSILLFSATVSAYLPAVSHDFVNYDDPDYVTSNVHVQKGLTWSNVKWAFCHPVVGNWHPLTLLSHMLDCQMYGLNPKGHHLTNVLLHGANTALVFLLLHRLTRAIWQSFMVAALFGLHPLHVESVAWVAERKDALSVFFGLLCLMAYARYQGKFEVQHLKSEGGNSVSGSYYWLALLCLALSLMSKPMLVTMPFVLLLLDYWPLARGWAQNDSALQSLGAPGRNEGGMASNSQSSSIWSLLLEKIPFFILAAVMSTVTYLVQQNTGMMHSLENVPFGARAGNALISYCRYLEKSLWPSGLAVFYPYPDYWPRYQVLLAAGFIVSISAFVFVYRKRYPYLLVGWLWYCGTLVPVIGLVQVGGQAMADRYVYFPLLGLLISVVWGISDLTNRWRFHPMASGGAACAVIGLCLGLTRQQLGYWQNNESLYRHTLAVTENNYLAHHNLGIALFKEGQIDEAISQYREALGIEPDYAKAHYNLGVALAVKGQTEEAIGQFREAIRIKPDYAEAHCNLGTALAGEGQIDEAIQQYRQAINLKPDNAEFHYDLGTALGMNGQVDEAIPEFQEALRLKPDYAAARHNLAHALQIKNSATGR